MDLWIVDNPLFCSFFEFLRHQLYKRSLRRQMQHKSGSKSLTTRQTCLEILLRSALPEFLIESAPHQVFSTTTSMAYRQSVFRELFDEVERDSEEATSSRLPRDAAPATRSMSISDVRDLRAARSEAWPCAGSNANKQAPEQSTNKKIEKRRSEAYIDVLHRASLQGFAAPPRHEIKEYQQKSLPPTPKQTEASGRKDRAENKPSPKSTARVDSFLGLSEADCKRRERQSLLVETGSLQKRETSSKESKPLSWICRVQRRAENNQRAHEFLHKRE